MSLQANEQCQHPGQAYCICKDVGESRLASATCYTALELMQLMCELRRNMDDAVTKINAENFDHAALCLECAAFKLRTIQRAVSAV